MRNVICLIVVTACSSKHGGDQKQGSGSAKSCPGDMVAIPAGTFTIGNAEGDHSPNDLPTHEVQVPAFCLDRTEVTVGAYATCVAASVCTPAATTLAESPNINKDYVQTLNTMCNGDKTDRAAHPVNCVDWNQAQVYCSWAKARLPSEEEWEYAARGTDGRRYPWGNEAPDATRLNAAGLEYKQLYATFSKRDVVPMYNSDDTHPTTAPVGTVAGDRSPFGVMDMGGNVWEWTASKLAATDSGTRYVGRGGGFDYNNPTWVRATHRSSSSPDFRYVSLGFRCAATAR